MTIEIIDNLFESSVESCVDWSESTFLVNRNQSSILRTQLQTFQWFSFGQNSDGTAGRLLLTYCTPRLAMRRLHRDSDSYLWPDVFFCPTSHFPTTRSALLCPALGRRSTVGGNCLRQRRERLLWHWLCSTVVQWSAKSRSALRFARLWPIRRCKCPPYWPISWSVRYLSRHSLPQRRSSIHKSSWITWLYRPSPAPGSCPAEPFGWSNQIGSYRSTQHLLTRNWFAGSVRKVRQRSKFTNRSKIC